MLETSISNFIDSISIYRSRVLDTRVPKSTWGSEERQRKNDSEKQRKNDLRHDLKKQRDNLKRKIWFEKARSGLQIYRRRIKKNRGRMIWGTIWRNKETIWRGTIWSSDLPSKNEGRSDTLKNARSTNRDSKTQFLSWNSSFRHSRC